jgi:GT2 family glycosyltransferase
MPGSSEKDTGDGIDLSVCVPVLRAHRAPNLASLAEQLPAAAGGLRTELVVVLNGIGADAAGVPPGATVVAFDHNRGVPVAWNAAARAARGRVLAFVNDDVALGPRSLTALYDALADERSGVVGPVGTHWDLVAARHVSWLQTDGLPAGAKLACEVISGFMFATRAETWLRAGGFDEAYSPCGFEEVDYCTTARLELGLECHAVAGVEHEHEFGVSAKRSWRRVRWDGRAESLGSIAARNRAHFQAKWAEKAKLAA